MKAFLLAKVLFSKGDILVTGDISYRYGDLVFMYAAAKLMTKKAVDLLEKTISKEFYPKRTQAFK